MKAPRKLAQAVGKRACRPYCRYLPGDALIGTLPTQATLRRWLWAGLIGFEGNTLVLSGQGATLLNKETTRG